MTTPQLQRRRERITIVLEIVVLFFLLVVVLKQVQINGRVTDSIDAVHDSQIVACESSLQPGGVRFVVADQIRSQLEQSKHLDYAKFFPGVPQDELKQLLAQSRQRQQQEIHDLLDVDCSAAYPTP